MNKADVIAKVATQSGVGEEDCRKVLKALETVLSDELGNSSGALNALDKVQKILSFLQGKST